MEQWNAHDGFRYKGGVKMAGAKLLGIINQGKTPQSELTDLLFGEVISTSPLQIRIDNRYTLTSEFLMLSSLVRSGTPGGEALRTGDRVRVLRCNGGQLFYVLEKENYSTVRHCTCTCDCEVED